MKGKGGEEGMKTGAGRVTKLFNYVPFFAGMVRQVTLKDEKGKVVLGAKVGTGR